MPLIFRRLFEGVLKDFRLRGCRNGVIERCTGGLKVVFKLNPCHLQCAAIVKHAINGDTIGRQVRHKGNIESKQIAHRILILGSIETA